MHIYINTEAESISNGFDKSKKMNESDSFRIRCYLCGHSLLNSHKEGVLKNCSTNFIFKELVKCHTPLKEKPTGALRYAFFHGLVMSLFVQISYHRSDS